MLDYFNPECVELTAENAFWVSGENEAGEIVVTFGGVVHDWHGTNLAEQARALFLRRGPRPAVHRYRGRRRTGFPGPSLPGRLPGCGRTTGGATCRS